MSNSINFTGRIAAAPERRETAGGGGVVKLTLMRNEYAGKDGAGNARERVVSLPLTAFGGKADAIYNNCRKGCQLIVVARIENNRYTDGQNVEHFDYNFIIEDFDFGAPGEIKRKELANRSVGPSDHDQD